MSQFSSYVYIGIYNLNKTHKKKYAYLTKRHQHNYCAINIVQVCCIKTTINISQVKRINLCNFFLLFLFRDRVYKYFYLIFQSHCFHLCNISIVSVRCLCISFPDFIGVTEKATTQNNP